jgi:hypothetical protein
LASGETAHEAFVLDSAHGVVGSLNTASGARCVIEGVPGAWDNSHVAWPAVVMAAAGMAPASSADIAGKASARQA